MVDVVSNRNQYSPIVGFVYVFNLIVGTGALTLPAAFKDAGYVLSTVIIIMLAFMSYLTATFMIEAMAAANALVHFRRLQRIKRHEREEQLVHHRRSNESGGVPVVAGSSQQSTPRKDNNEQASQSQPQSPAVSRTGTK